MKRFISVILCASFAFAAASCGSAKETFNSTIIDSVQTTVETEKETVKDNDGGNTGSGLTFSTADRNGKTYDESIFKDCKVTMINFWEPWCGPCVGEIPDLEKLYEEFKDEDFQIIGVYSETEMEDEVDEILSSSGVTYPILRYTSEFDQFDSGYVPTTVFIDSDGNVLTLSNGEDNFVGSRSFEEWAELVRFFLK